MLGFDADEDAGFACWDETEAMADLHAVRALLLLGTLAEFAEGPLGHGQVGGVVNAGDGAPILDATDGAEKLRLRPLFVFEHRGVRENGVCVDLAGKKGHDEGALNACHKCDRKHLNFVRVGRTGNC